MAWLQGENGLRFGQHGTALSSEAFGFRPVPDFQSCSLELWLQPERSDEEATIIAFDSSADPSLPFSLRQYGNAVAVQRYMIDAKGIVRRPWLKVDGVLHAHRTAFLTLVSGKQETTVYLDGSPAARSSTLGFASSDLRGRLVLANSTVDDSWSGQITGLAVYDYELTAQQVERHFKSWAPNTGPALEGEKRPVALYLFNEHSGAVVLNRSGSSPDLRIPARYSVVHPPFLQPVWSQYYQAAGSWSRWGYWSDIAQNIVGFVPVGFVLLAYFSQVKPIPRSAMIVVVLGFVISFTIEALQRFLPTRDSGMSDLITNTLGTFLGVLLFRLSAGILGRKAFGARQTIDANECF